MHDGIRIVVLYNSASVDRSKCPEALSYEGTHVAMCFRKDVQLCWDYQAVKNVIG